MRLPQIAETGSTTDMDEAMQEVVPFENYVDPSVWSKPKLLKLVSHKHLVEYVTIRQLEQPTFRFGADDDDGQDVTLFSNFCNNYTLVKNALMNGQPEAWEKHIKFLGPGKIVQLPNPEPESRPGPSDSQASQDLEIQKELDNIMDSQEIKELASRGGWLKATLTETVMQVLKRADTIDTTAPQAPPGTIAAAAKPTNEELVQNIRETEQQQAEAMKHQLQQSTSKQDQEGTTAKHPAERTTCNNQDQEGTTAKDQAQCTTNKQDQKGTTAKDSQNTTSNDQDQKGTTAKDPQNTTSNKQDQKGTTAMAPAQVSTSNNQDQEGTTATAPAQNMPVKKEPQQTITGNRPENPGPDDDHGDSDLKNFRQRRAGYMRFYRTLQSP